MAYCVFVSDHAQLKESCICDCRMAAYMCVCVCSRWMVPISVEATLYVRALERKGRMAALGIQKIIIGSVC